MNNSKISIRYAKALIKLAKGEGILDKVKSDVSLIKKYLEDANFTMLISRPDIFASEKIKILDNLFQDSVNFYTLSFLKLLVKNSREQFLPDIIRLFFTEYEKISGIKYAQLLIAAEVDEKTRQNIKEFAENIIKQKLIIEEVINPDIVGGFILNTSDLQIDTSINSRINKLQKILITK